MGVQLSWLKCSTDNRKTTGSNPVIPTRKENNYGKTYYKRSNTSGQSSKDVA